MRKCKPELILCSCGICGEFILSHDRWGNERKYKVGHDSRMNPLTDTRIVKERTIRRRAKRILTEVLGKDKCEVDNGLCHGKLQAHHIDKNPYNNSIDNLLLLCDTHHNFADNRNLSLDELKNLNLTFNISSNKRRYKKSLPDEVIERRKEEDE